MTIDPRLHRIVAAQPYPLLFATISGAHLYGFPSPDSDFDLRGAHVLPIDAVVGLEVRDETVQQEMMVPPDTSSGLRQPSPVASRHPLHSQDTPHPASGHLLPIRCGEGKSDGRGASPAPAGEGQCAEGRALEMDIVSHDVKKFFGLLLKKNGYVLEQLFSPLIVHTTPEHAELMEICRTKKSNTSPNPLPGRGGEGGASRPHPQPLSHPMGEGSVGSNTSPRPSPHLTPPPLSNAEREKSFPRLHESSLAASSMRQGFGEGVITKHHSHHYFGFAETQWKLFLKGSGERPPLRRVKPLLYVYRVLLTGIHLMRTGEIEANLVTLNEEFRLPYITDLVARKLAGPEKSKLDDTDIVFHEAEYQRLRGELQAAHDASTLPELPSDATRAALNDLLVRIRLKSGLPQRPEGGQ